VLKIGKLIATTLAMAAIAVVGATTACAADQDFDAFWQKFKTALQKNDKPALVSMTQCPFLFRDKQLSKAELGTRIDTVLPAKTRRCLSTQHPKPDKGSYFAFCGDLVYSFEKVGGHYMFTAMDAAD
jgi:hypothetical protein